MGQFSKALLVSLPHLHYLVIDRQWQITEFSPEVVGFGDEPETIALAQDIRDAFPELMGCEDFLMPGFQGETLDFCVKGVNRWRRDRSVAYLDLYVCPLPNLPDHLLLVVEDVTDKMSLEQSLVQATNETALLVSRLRSAQTYADSIIQAMGDALIVTDFAGRIKTINQIAQSLFHDSADQLLGRSFGDLLAPEDRRRWQVFSQQLIQGERLTASLEITCLTRQGDRLILDCSCSVVQTEIEDYQDLIYVGRDITQWRRSQQRMMVQYAIAQTLSETDSLEEATPAILESVCTNVGFALGELWIAEQETPLPLLTAVIPRQTCPSLRREYWWAADPEPLQQFLQITQRVRLVPGFGLAGMVWESGSPQWIANLTENRAFGIASFAVQAGLCSAFAFPIMADHQVLGVMTFFTNTPQTPDRELLQVMAATGRQLGQYIKRKEAERFLAIQQQQTERLLLNVLPQSIVEQLKSSASPTIADQFDQVSILFADLVGFTSFAANLSPVSLLEILNQIFSEFDALTARHGLEKIKTLGDAYMVVSGLPQTCPRHASKIACMALDMQRAIARLNGDLGYNFQLRIGINSGPVIAGVIGTKKFIYDLWGDAVNVASRMESQGVPGKIQLTAATRDLLGDGFWCEERGQIEVKGRGLMTTYFLIDRQEHGAP